MRVTEYLDAIARTLRAAGLFEDVRVQLDPYDLDDVVKESFRPPAARVLFSLAKPVPTAPGAFDLEMTVTIVVITARSGRPDPAFASADVAALDLTVQACQLVSNDPYFGVPKVTAAAFDGFKVAVSEKSNAKGLAITVVMLKSTLLDVVTERDELADLTGRRLPGMPVELPPELHDLIAKGDDDAV